MTSPPPVADDGELVRRARTGDHDACDELARRYRRPAYLLALQMLGNPDDAMDVAQDSMLRFFTKLNRFDANRPVKPWLLTIVRNRARDLFRRRKVRRAESLEPNEDEEGYAIQLIDESANPERDSRRQQLQRMLWRALGELPPAQREILVLRDYQDLSYAEIANVLNVPMGTVMSRLHRARKGLKQILQETHGPHAFEGACSD